MKLARVAVALLVITALSAPVAVAAMPAPGVVPSYCLRNEGGYRCLVGPFEVGAGEMHEIMTGVAAPSETGYITWGQARLVDGDGKPVSHHAVHLHHAVWLNPYEDDMTCDSYDNGSFPGFERFFATGKEATKLALPGGYGYLWDPRASNSLTQSAPWWAFTAHLDGMHGSSDVYVQFDMGFVPASEAGDMTNIEPVWLDVRNCSSDPVYDVPKRQGLHKERWTYRMLTGGRFVALAGHLHDGGLRLKLDNVTADDHV
ncbi:MAG: hypothetical protein M3174_00460, partial [Actinomycetota bacterium]|nr:hypothetical protein [Actinomycetota bacterium]